MVVYGCMSTGSFSCGLLLVYALYMHQHTSYLLILINSIGLTLQVAQEIETEAKYQNDFLNQLVCNSKLRNFIDSSSIAVCLMHIFETNQNHPFEQ